MNWLKLLLHTMTALINERAYLSKHRKALMKIESVFFISIEEQNLIKHKFKPKEKTKIRNKTI